MNKVTISEFRKNLLKYLVKAKNGTELVITSHGRELARVSAPKDKAVQARARLRELADTAYVGDVISPVS